MSECRLKQLGFSNITYDRIFFSQWRIPPIAIIIYKLILAVYVNVWMIITASHKGLWGHYPWSVWLTNWTYILLTVHLNVSALAAIVYHVVRARHSLSKLCSLSPDEHRSLMRDGNNHDSAEIPIHSMEMDQENSPDTALVRSGWIVAVPWILHDMACTFVPLVTILFFAILFPYQSPENGIGMDNLQLHGINSVCMLIDFTLHAVPVRLLHFIYPTIYGLFYVVFSVVYWSGDHRRVIYPVILDWNHPGRTTGIIFGVLVAIIVLHLIFFGLHKLKTWIYHKVCCSQV